MSADDDTGDFECGDGVGEGGEKGHVGCVEDVCDVAVGEDLAWVGGAEGGFWAARVGAAEPEERWGLTFGICGEDFRVRVGEFFVPGGVGGEEGSEGICFG